MNEHLEIDKSSPVPLYHQLRRALEKRIKEGIYKRDHEFSSEHELCRLYDVSRTTVRQTIREMLDDGILYRESPRGRPLVAPAKVRQHLTWLEGFFTKGVFIAGMEPNTRVLSAEEAANPTIKEKMGLGAQDRLFCVQRLHEGDGEPLAYQTSYVPERVLPHFMELDWTQSLFTYIQENYHSPIVRGIQRIGARQPTSKERELLKLTAKATVFQIDRTTYAEDGTAVEFFECILSGDRYNFMMELTLNDDGTETFNRDRNADS